jgi:hypothetical protein
MPGVEAIPAKVRAQFSESANRSIQVAHAWRPLGDRLRPGSEARDEGWTIVHRPASVTVLMELRDQGFTWVDLRVGDVAKPGRDVPLSPLI